jgi:multiple sugar transport system substrate-binding protein
MTFLFTRAIGCNIRDFHVFEEDTVSTRHSYRTFLLVSALVIVSLILAACAPTAQPTQAPAQPAATEAPAQPAATEAPAQPTAAPSGEKTKIVFWSHDFPPREKLDRKFMDQFMADNPNVEIEYVLGPGDDVQYITKLMTAFAGGEAPDCFNLLTFSTGPLLEQGLVAPVDPTVYGFSSQEELEKTYVIGTLEGFKKDNVLYAMPSEVSIYSLFQNKQMYADAGLDVEQDYPKTWEDLIPLAQKMNKEENGQLVKRAFDFTYGMPEDATSPVLSVAGMAYQLGGKLLSDDGTESLVNTEPWVKSFQFIQDWVYKEKAGNPALTVAFVDFYQGNTAGTLSGSWYSSYVKEQNPAVAEQIVVKPFPQWKEATNKNGALMYAYGLFTNAGSSPEKQAACQLLIKELSSHPEDYLRDAGLLQSRADLPETETFKQDPTLPVFLSDMEGTPYFPAHPKAFEMLDVLTRALQRVVTEQQDPQESLDAAKAEIDALLQQQ